MCTFLFPHNFAAWHPHSLTLLRQGARPVKNSHIPTWKEGLLRSQGSPYGFSLDQPFKKSWARNGGVIEDVRKNPRTGGLESPLGVENKDVGLRLDAGPR